MSFGASGNGILLYPWGWPLFQMPEWLAQAWPLGNRDFILITHRHRSPGHHVEGGSAAEIFVVRSATRSMRQELGEALQVVAGGMYFLHLLMSRLRVSLGLEREG